MTFLDLLTRKELQQELKARKLLATGTTVALRERYAYALLSGDPSPDLASRYAQKLAAANHNSGASSTGSSSHRSTTENKKPVSTHRVAKKKVNLEKRLRKFRPSCNEATRDRIHRALSQRMYLIQQKKSVLESSFVVLGSTGNVYTVQIGHTANCTCPDHQRKRGLCKHILFVLLKVIGIPKESYLVYQAAWMTSELEEMHELHSNRHIGGSIVAKESVRKSYKKFAAGEDSDDSTPGRVIRKSLDKNGDDECPICCDSLDPKEEPLTYCRAECGSNYHAACIQKWISAKNYHGVPKKEITCPMCRQCWVSGTKKKVPTREGYSNLGHLQGQPTERDTSTYRTSPYMKWGRYY